jgi:hypothetical protein
MLDATEPQLAVRADSSPIATAGPVVVTCQRDVLAWACGTIDALNISREEVDALCGFGQRYSNNLLNPRPTKRVAIGSMFRLVRGLGHKIQLVPDDEAMAVLLTQITRRKLRVSMLTVKNRRGLHGMVSKRFLKKIAPLGGAARTARMNPSWLRGAARKAALARWKLYRAAKVTRPGAQP